MKRKIAAIDIFVTVLTAVLLALYILPPVREFLTSSSAQFFKDAYAFFDKFYSKLWSAIFSRFISPTPSIALQAVFTSLVLLIAFLLVVDVLFGLIYRAIHNAKLKREYNEKAELERLNSPIDFPSSFVPKEENREQVANVIAPRTELLDEEAKKADGSGGEKIRARSEKDSPTVRIILSIVYSVLVLIFLFFRFVAQAEWEPVYSAFEAFYGSDFIRSVNAGLDSFFLNFIGEEFYGAQIGEINSVPYKNGQLFELISLFLVAALLLVLVLLIAHAILISYRKKKNRRAADEPYGVEDVDWEKQALLGFKPSEDASKLPYIAETHPYPDTVKKKDLAKQKADYLADIGEKVHDAGVRPSLFNSSVLPSPVRVPLVKEEVGEDLSKNVNVQEKDIASIEDSLPKEDKTIAVRFEPAYALGDTLSEIHSENDDAGLISEREPRIEENVSPQKEDLISFDEDGYAYLVKQGKPFTDFQEDIPDVIKNRALSETAAVSRYGKKVYDLLNSLEPFELEPLDYSQETGRAEEQHEKHETEKREERLRRFFTEQPFANLSIQEDVEAKEKENGKTEEQTEEVPSGEKKEEEKPVTEPAPETPSPEEKEEKEPVPAVPSEKKEEPVPATEKKDGSPAGEEKKEESSEPVEGVPSETEEPVPSGEEKEPAGKPSGIVRPSAPLKIRPVSSSDLKFNKKPAPVPAPKEEVPEKKEGEKKPGKPVAPISVSRTPLLKPDLKKRNKADVSPVEAKVVPGKELTAPEKKESVKRVEPVRFVKKPDPKEKKDIRPVDAKTPNKKK